MIFFKTKQTSKQANKQNHKTALQGSISFFFVHYSKNQVNFSFIFLFDHLLFSFSSPSTFYFFSDHENIENKRRKKKNRGKGQKEDKQVKTKKKSKIFAGVLTTFYDLWNVNDFSGLCAL